MINNIAKATLTQIPIKTKVKTKIKSGIAFSIVAYTIMIAFCLLCILPMINVLAISFSSPNISVGLLPKHFTLYAYKYVLSSMGFYKAYGMTLFIAIAGTLISVVINFLAAYPLSKRDLPFRKFFMVFFIIMMLFSGGMIPNLLWFKTIGIIDTPIIMILPIAVQFYYITLFISYLENLPLSIEEAAKIDGASNMQMLARIVLPMCVPIVITISLFTIVGYWNNYNLALFYAPTNKDIQPLALYVLTILQGSSLNDTIGNPEAASFKPIIEACIIILTILPIVAGYPFFLKYFTQGTAVGSVKE